MRIGREHDREHQPDARLPGIAVDRRAMLEDVGPRLTQGVAVIVRSVTVRLVEGRIAEDLAAIQKAHPAVSIGSYPFFADAGGPAGTTLVIRGRDGWEVEMAEHEILQLALSLGVTPEKTGDSR